MQELHVDSPLVFSGLVLPKRATFLSYIHSFRGLAVLLIVAGHCVESLRWQRFPYILWIICSNGTVLFVFIAGFLFQHLSGKYRYGDYLKSKFKNVILPYLILSVPAIIYHEALRWDPSDSLCDVALQTATFYLTGASHERLLVYPDDRHILSDLAAADLVGSSPKGLLVASPAPWRLAVRASQWIADRGELRTFFSVYLLGMLCSRYREQVFVIVGRLVPILLVLAISCVVAAVLRVGPEGALNLVQKLSLCALLLYWLKRYDQSLKQSFAYLATVSFGLYFIHPYVLEAFMKLPELIGGKGFLACSRVHFIADGSIAVWLACFVAATLLSLFVVAIARRLFGPYSRMIVGS